MKTDSSCTRDVKRKIRHTAVSRDFVPGHAARILCLNFLVLQVKERISRKLRHVQQRTVCVHSRSVRPVTQHHRAYYLPLPMLPDKQPPARLACKISDSQVNERTCTTRSFEKLCTQSNSLPPQPNVILLSIISCVKRWLSPNPRHACCAPGTVFTSTVCQQMSRNPKLQVDKIAVRPGRVGASIPVGPLSATTLY